MASPRIFFQLDNNLPDINIIEKIKNSSYSYLIKTWENINPQIDDQNNYRVLESKNVKELKNMARNNNLKVGGTKQELINRLIELGN